MRINNPKSLAGFVLEETSQSNSYSLATVGQLDTAIGRLNNKFEEILAGVAPRRAGGQGLVKKQGYAWLAEDGKVDASLLPALAITDTHLTTEEVLANYGAESNSIYDTLNLWAQDSEREGTAFQKGDIIIVRPSDTVESSTQDLAIESGLVKNPDPTKSGTYIITEMTDKNGEPNVHNFTFAKMAYTDSNIVTINDVAPTNSTGRVILRLRDILKTGTYLKDLGQGNNTSSAAAAELEDVVFRLAKVEDGEGFRFAFINSINDADSVVELYAKLDELNAEASARFDNDYRLSGLVSGLSERITNLGNKIGNETNASTRAISGSVWGQLKGLSRDLDANARILQQTRTDTNLLISNIQENITSFYNRLEGKAIAIIEKTIDWSDSSAVSVVPEEYPAEVINGELSIHRAGIKGLMHYTYTYLPPIAGTTNGLDNITGNSAEQTLSEERIIAIYDEQGNKIEADIEVKPYESIHKSLIHVTTDWVVNDQDEQVGVLTGQWKLIIAKTIIGMRNNIIEKNVGGSSSEAIWGEVTD